MNRKSKSKPENISIIEASLMTNGFSNIQYFDQEYQGVNYTKIMGDTFSNNQIFTLQMFAGRAGQCIAIFPQLLIGRGDFPQVDRVYDPEDGCALNGANPEIIIASVKQRINQMARAMVNK